MSREADYLLMMSDKDIDYNRLSEEILAQLALDIEPYIANSALTELWVRQNGQAADIAWKILLGSIDESLQATALKIVFALERDRALDYMIEQAQNSNLNVLNTMVELILYETDFRVELQVAGLIKERLARTQNKADHLDLGLNEDFKKVLEFV